MAAVWRTPSQEESDSLFDRLAAVTRTVIMPIVRRRLHASLDPADTDQRNLDALDLVSEIRVTVFAELTKNSPSGAEDAAGGEIRDLSSFTSAVASNACYQYLREKFPVRTQQRNRLRYVLTHRQGFALWKSASGELLCGLKKWENFGAAPVPLATAIEDLPRPSAGADDARIYLAAVRSVLLRANGPVRFDDLVEYLMHAFGVAKRVELQSGSDIGRFSLESIFADPSPPPDRQLESVDDLKELWKAIRQHLSVNQRRALILNLREARPDSLISVLPLSGVASIREIAEVLDFEAVEFARIWDSLPWDDLRIAEHLGLTRQQVINLRHSARVRLARICRP
jgi:hypothetical protein